MNELLTAAVVWSCAGDSRVLLTSRIGDFGHPDYRIEGTRIHRRIALEGLGSAAYPDDALGWFGELSKLPPDPSVPPPKRDELIELFDRVKFHPLSICVLAQQLKTRTAKKLGERLEQILSEAATSSIAVEGTPRSLIASLELSLERLSERERHAVRRLGAFQGGALESELLAITGLGESDQRERLQTPLAALDSGDPRVVLRLMGVEIPDDAEIPAELLAQFTGNPELEKHIEQLRALLASLPATKNESGAENLWPGLRRQLESAALIEAANIPGVGPPFLRFHPTLAPMLWAGLEAHERDALTTAHRQRYYAVAGYLYDEDRQDPHQARAIARRELPNLLHAVHCALDAGDADAVEFVDCVNKFLNNFGMTGEAASLTKRAAQAGGQRGSRAWFLAQSNRGEQLRTSGHAGEAADIFADILQTLEDQSSFDRTVTLGRLGRCYEGDGRHDLAEATYRQGIAVTEQLQPSDQVKRHRAVLQAEVGIALMLQGKYAAAREQYELALCVSKDLKDLHFQGVTQANLGHLAAMEGNVADAVTRCNEALHFFQRLHEPSLEANTRNLLGAAYQKAGQWEQAEQHFREAARLAEQLGERAKAAAAWNNLAVVSNGAGRPEAGETWYRKAIDGMQNPPSGDRGAKCLSNLADLLRAQPGRLDEARELAEESLAIGKTLDPGAAAIWRTYDILAEIAAQQSQSDRATEYRSLARQAKRNFAGTAHEMKRYQPLILETLQAIHGPDTADDFRTTLSQMEKHGRTNLVAAIRRILAGERNEQALCAALDFVDSMIIETILHAIDDPTTLSALLPPEGKTNT